MAEVNCSSVLELLQSLVKCFFNEQNKLQNLPDSQINPSIAQDAMRNGIKRAYDVLLLGPPSVSEVDPLEELKIIHFEMLLTDQQESQRFGSCVQNFLGVDTDIGDTERAVLTFLLSLRGFKANTAEPMCRQPAFFQDSFRNHYERKSNPYINSYTIPIERHRSCFDLNEIKSRESLYTKRKPGCNFFTFALTHSVPSICPNPLNKLPLLELAEEVHTVIPAKHKIFLKSPTWNNLNVPLDRASKHAPFASESQPAFLQILRKQRGVDFQPKMLSTAQLISDIKYLLVGVQSETFAFDADTICFEMRQNVALMDVTPDTSLAAMEPFLECGACCARLKMMCNQNVDFSYKLEGFVFKTLCSSIEQFLRFYEQFVDAFADDSVLQLANRMSVFMKQISMMAKLLAIHPNVAENPSVVPCGSEFLGYLYNEITELTNEDVATLFVYLLQECCRVYFRFFEKWIFHGFLEDPCHELFIEHSDCRPNTKHFWDKAYQIKQHAVPGFLHGFEEVTLLCGKYTMLLKAFRPTHPLLSVDAPTIDVCLSAAQITALRHKCAAHAQRLQAVCGDPISVRSVFQQYASSKAEYRRKASEAFVANHVRWTAEQHQRTVTLRAAQTEQRQTLQRQIAEAHERQVQRRHDRLALDRQCLESAQRVDDERTATELEHRRKRIEYYTELGDLVEKQKADAEQEIRDLKAVLAMEREKTLKMDLALGTDSESSVAEDQNKNPILSGADDATTASDRQVPCYPLSKSPSDMLNANANLGDIATYNRMIVLGTTHDFQQHLTANSRASRDDNSNPLPAATASCDTVSTNSASSSVAHMEMLQNRAKVMGQEYDLFDDANNSSPRTMSARASDPDKMSALQRNRHKVLTEEYGSHLVAADADASSVARPATSRGCDLRANRHRQMCGDAVSDMYLDLNDAHDGRPFETPMSTSSDTPNRKLEDSLPQAPPLRLDIDVCVGASCSSEFVTAATDGPAFPFDKDLGIDGSCSSVYESARSRPDASSDGEFDFQPDDACPTPAAPPETPCSNYSRFLKPDTRRRFFSRTQSTGGGCPPEVVHDDDATDATEATASVVDAAPPSACDLSNPNVSSITHYLRLSFVLPLHAHLNVLRNELLKAFLVDFNIVGQFKSLRNYFLMMDGEFASHICDGLIGKLERNAAVGAHRPNAAAPADILNVWFLHTLLDQALGSSIIGNDPNADRLSFYVDQIPDRFDLSSPNVLHMLNLSYAVEWPLSLLLTPDTIAAYGRLFRHLLKLRRVRYVLDQTTQLLKAVARGGGPRCHRSAQFRHVQQLRNKLLHFVHGMQNHITANALQASWRRFKDELQRAQSIEDVYQMHTRYLKQVAFLCMINSSAVEFNAMLDNVWTISLRFYHKLQRHQWQFDADGIYTHPKFGYLLTVETDFHKLMAYIVHAGVKMSQRGYQSEIGDFVSMINFNGYYDRPRK